MTIRRSAVSVHLIAVVGFVVHSQAATLLVPDDQPTIALAISNSLSGDTILVAAGTYSEYGFYNCVINNKTLRIAGQSTDPVVIDCMSVEGRRAFKLASGACVTIDGFVFLKGSAPTQSSFPGDEGGAIKVEGSSLTVSSCTFQGNVAHRGGAIAARGGDLRIRDCTFVHNEAGGLMPTPVPEQVCKGGAVYVAGCSSLVAQNSTFCDNRASRPDLNHTYVARGCGICLESVQHVVLDSCTITNSCSDTQELYGGGLCYSFPPGPAPPEDLPLIRVINCDVLDNMFTTSSYSNGFGGGVCLYGYFDASFDQVRFLRNSISGAGPHTYRGAAGLSLGVDVPSELYRDPIIRLADCTFEGNSTDGSAGGAYLSCHAELRSCSLVANEACLGSGGGLFCDWDLAILECLIKGNEARESGGGAFLDEYSGASFVNSVIAENRSTQGYGGGVYGWDATIELEACTTTDNWAYLEGGGVASINCYGYDQLTVHNCIFWGNESQTTSDDQIAGRSTRVDVTFSDVAVPTPGQVWPGNGNMNAPPRLGSGFQLQSDSPCRGAAEDCGVTTDRDGDARPWESGAEAPDIGADEYVGFEPPPLTPPPTAGGSNALVPGKSHGSRQTEVAS